jgi:hypothetical protein
MPGVEEIPAIVRTVVDLAPALKEVPILRGLIVPLMKVPGNDTQELENYLSAVDKRKKQRQKTRTKNARYVIKISDAMQCVEDTVMSGQIAIQFGKALVTNITGKTSGVSAGDGLYDQILQCMLKKRLQQKNKRSWGRYAKTRGPGIEKVPGMEEQFTPGYSEIVRVRRGRLHPFIPK